MKMRFKNLIFIALTVIGSVSAEIQLQPVSTIQAPTEYNEYFKEARQLIKSDRSAIAIGDPSFLSEDSFINGLKKCLVSSSVKQMMVAYGCINGACSRVTPDNAPKLYAFVEKTCLKFGIAVPRIYIAHDSRFVNCVAGGDMILLGLAFLFHMDRNGAEFVIAHELGHIAQKNIELKKTALAIVTSIPGLLATAYFIKTESFKSLFIPTRAFKKRLLLISANIVGQLINSAYSRSLEYDADKKAYHATGNLAGAKKMFEFAHKMEAAVIDKAQPFATRFNGYISQLKYLRSHPSPPDRLHVLSA